MDSGQFKSRRHAILIVAAKHLNDVNGEKRKPGKAAMDL